MGNTGICFGRWLTLEHHRVMYPFYLSLSLHCALVSEKIVLHYHLTGITYWYFTGSILEKWAMLDALKMAVYF